VTRIALSRGLFAVVDDGDVDRVSGYRWYAKNCNGRVYAAAHSGSRTVYMHRLILETPDGLVSDHLDGDGLNNRRANLQAVPHSLNILRSKKHSRAGGMTSRFPGVHFSKRNAKRPWLAMIGSRDNRKYLGYFEDEQSAAAAYQSARAERELSNG